MSHASGAGRPAPPVQPCLSSAASGLASSAVRFARALAGLFGLELRETGAHALVLAGLCVAFIVACVFAYLFLLVAAGLAISSWCGGGWMAVLLGLFVFHLLMAGGLLFVLVNRAKTPLFPATREAIRREVEELS